MTSKASSDSTTVRDGQARHAAEAVLKEQVRAQVAGALFGRPQEVTVGRFALVERIGAGAMGHVFEAIDPTLERTVALKVITGAGKVTPEVLLGEARALAQLSHPNVVTVYEAGVTEEGIVYCAMERLDGIDLGAWWRQHPPSAERVIEVIAAVGRGLGAAHEQGVVHRDVKPANIVMSQGRPTLVDFGVARRTLAAGGDHQEGYRSAGTPSYMAPEQRRGDTGDSLADQWALATIAHEALGGAPDRAIGDVLARALADDPHARFPTVLAFVDALERAQVPPQRRQGMVLALALLAVIGVALFFAARPGAPAAPSPALSVPTPAVTVTAHGEPERVLDLPEPTRAVPHELIARARRFMDEAGPKGSMLVSASFPTTREGTVDVTQNQQTGGVVSFEWIDADDPTKKGKASVTFIGGKMLMAREDGGILERQGKMAKAFPLPEPRCPASTAFERAESLDTSRPAHLFWEMRNPILKDGQLVWRIVDGYQTIWWFDAATCDHLETRR